MLRSNPGAFPTRAAIPIHALQALHEPGTGGQAGRKVGSDEAPLGKEWAATRWTKTAVDALGLRSI